MRCTRVLAFAGLRQALEFHGLLAGGDPWCEAIRQRLEVLRQRPLTCSELWTINKLVEAVIGRVLGLNPHQNLAANSDDARQKTDTNNRRRDCLSA
jgi:hypothetical protein